MRLICTLDDQHRAYALSTYLTRQGIENKLEVNTNRDWGSPEYGMASCTIWVYDEDQVDLSLQISDDFLQDPDNPRFYKLSTNGQSSIEADPMSHELPKGTPSQLHPVATPIGPVTLYILIICSLLLFFSTLTAPAVKSLPPHLPAMPIFSSPLEKELIYDYPQAYEIVDQLMATYGSEPLQNPDSLPPQGKKLFQKFLDTPYWQGIYPKFVHHYQNSNEPWEFNAPLFEKIGQGQIWRLFTPCMLHAGLFHLFFNMIWLVVIGKQIEQRIGKMRYLLFIVFTAIISNTAQYVMSGPDFVGFSGVLCAMLAFVWQRQRSAAWEGYHLQQGTISFVAFFILFMLALQIGSFFLEANGSQTFAVSIANTAHLTGALAGYILAHFSFFSWQTGGVE